jgi:hypothetical protein
VPAPQRRPWIAVVGLTLFLLGLLLVAGGVAILDWPLTRVTVVVGDLVILGVCSIPSAVGLTLVHVGDPGVARRTLRSALGRWIDLSTMLRSPATWWRALAWCSRTSLGLGVLIVAGCLPLMYALRPAAGLISLSGVTLYSVVDPALNVVRRSFWLNSLFSILVWLLVLAVLVGVTDSIQHLGDDMMIFLVPFEIYPVMLGISGIARLGLWRARRQQAPASQ